MRRILKRTVSLLLALVLIFGMVQSPISVAAKTRDTQSDSAEQDALLEKLKTLTSEEDKEEYAQVKEQYLQQAEHPDKAQHPTKDNYGMIWNSYLEVAVSSTGRFTLGTVEGNPDYTSDNYQLLLYGHSNPSTSETLIVLDDREFYFEADTVTVDNTNGVITATMNIDNVVITQVLSFIENSATGRADNVRISYTVINGGNTSHSVGIRIMMDTMLAYNDHAPFKVAGYGNVTTAKVLEGDAITQTYQVYDDLDNPTTMANGVLWLDHDRHPDKVQYSNWGNIFGSSWDHYVSDGDYLGDSSVAIYFNPVTVAGGTSMNVNTYYGTGLGLDNGSTSNNINNIRVTEGQFAIYVLDSKTNKAVTNATVTLEGIGSIPTNSSGAAVFDISSAFNGQDVSCTVSHSDYAEKTEIVKVEAGKADSLYIKAANDRTPLITQAVMTSSEAEYNNKDLLSSNVYFNSNAENTPSNRNNSYKINISVTSDMEGCIYQLIAGNHVKMESADGKFELTALTGNGNGKTFTRHRIEGLSAGEKVYVKAISRDGVSSQETLLGIKVSPPSTYATNITNDISFTPKISLGDLGDAATICRILFGTDELDLKEDKKLPLDISIDQDGKVRAAYNLFEKDWATTEENYAKIVANRASAAKAFGAKASSYGLGKAKVGFSVAGYGEGYFNNGALTINLGIYATLSGTAEYTHTFFLGFIPVYIKVGASAELAAEFGATIVNDGKFTLKITTGKLNPSFSIYAEAGAGISGMLSVGVQGKGTLGCEVDFVEDHQSVTLSASASIELHAFLFHDSIRVAQKTWVLYDSYNKRQSSGTKNNDQTEDLYRAHAFRMKSRDYLNTRSGDIYEMNSSVYTDARPLLIQVGQRQYRFWIDDDIDRISANRTALMCAFTDEYGSWGTPFILDDDNTADFAFDVAVVNDSVYIAYQESCKSYTEQDEESILADGVSGLATMAADSVISLLRVSGSDVTDLGTVSNGSTVGNTVMGSMLPKIAVNGNVATVAWTSNSENDVLAEKDDAVHYVWYTSATLSDQTTAASFATPKQISTGTTPLTALDAGNVNDQLLISYVLDEDQDFNTVSDRKLYLASALNTASPTIRLLTNSQSVSADQNPTFTTIDGTDALIWFENGNYYYFTTTADQVSGVFGSEHMPSSASNGYAVLQGQDSTAIVWCAVTSNQLSQELAYTLYAVKEQNGVWGIPYEVGALTDIDTPTISSLSGYLDAENECVVSYAVVKYDNETFELLVSSLNLFEESENTSAQVLYMQYDTTQAYSGNTFQVTACYKNTGTVPLTSATIEFYGQYFDVDLSSDPLLPSETRELVFDVNASTSDCGYYSVYFLASGNNDGRIYAQTAEDMSIYMNDIDVGVKQGEMAIIGNAEYFTFIVENKSNLTADNVNLKILLDESQLGAVVADERIGTMAPNEKTTILLKKDLLGSSTVAYGRLTSGNQDRNLYNNELLICNNVEVPDTIALNTLTVQPSDAAMGSVSVDDSFTAGENGGFTKPANTNDAIILSAVPANDRYAFVRWQITGSGTLEDKYAPETVYYMGDGEAVVTAVFMPVSPMTGIRIPQSVSIENGEEYVFAPTVTPASTSDHIVWTSSNTDVVTVDEDGYVTTVGLGTATIRAISSGNDTVYAETQITVTDILIREMYMTYPSYTLEGLGATATLNVICSPANATEAVRFESADPSIVTVSDTGEITAVGNGTTTVSVYSESGGATATATVTVTQPIQSISFERNNILMNVGDSKTVSFQVNPADTTETIDPENIVWSSSDPSITSVVPSEDGTSAVITQQAEGNSVIMVLVNGEFAATMTVIGRDLTVVEDLEDFQSSHDYESNIDHYWAYTIPDATQIVISFSEDSATEGGCDFLYVYGQNLQEIASFSGTDMAGQSITVPGDTVVVRLQTDGSVVGYGFKVTSAVATIDIAGKTTNASVTDWKCTAEGTIPQIEVTYNGTELVAGQDYTIAIAENVATITGIGSFVGERTLELGEPSDDIHSYTETLTPATPNADGKIVKQCDVCGKISKEEVIKAATSITLSAKAYTYDGKVKTPNVIVKDSDGKQLVKGTDYTVTYSAGRTNIGTYTVKITLTGNYTGTKTLSFKINPISISKCSVKLSATSFTYNGKVRTPSVTVKDANGKTLKKNTDYTVTYASGRKNVGTYKVTIRMKGNYTGTKTLTFKINPISISKCSVKLSATSFTYNGKVRTPKVIVKDANGKTLKKNTHYTVTYASGRKNVGTYKVTIKMKGSYKGTKTLTFKINPVKTKISKIVTATKALTVKLVAKKTQVTGYQIQYSTNKNFRNAKIRTVTGVNATTVRLSKLLARTNYYVRVRTFKTVNGVKYYSGWSVYKTARTK